jgi:cytidylate kinase
MSCAESSSADRLIVTVDGPAGTGKSTVAHRLGERLGLAYLDTGAMYRAAALIAIEAGIAPDDGDGLADALARTSLHFNWQTDPPRLMLGDRDVSRRIRDMDVSAIVSIVAAQSAVRCTLVAQQRRAAEEHPRLVTEGRDQGSVVFPDATVRFYLDARAEVRAQRRVAQLAEAGAAVDEEEVRADIGRRDHIDSTRADSPLTCPSGAIVVDTSDLTIDEVVQTLQEHVEAALQRGRSDG